MHFTNQGNKQNVLNLLAESPSLSLLALITSELLAIKHRPAIKSWVANDPRHSLLSHFELSNRHCSEIIRYIALKSS